MEAKVAMIVRRSKVSRLRITTDGSEISGDGMTATVAEALKVLGCLLVRYIPVRTARVGNVSTNHHHVRSALT
jgi:hypothetical protein